MEDVMEIYDYLVVRSWILFILIFPLMLVTKWANSHGEKAEYAIIITWAVFFSLWVVYTVEIVGYIVLKVIIMGGV
jgi:hypothetical protein